MLRQAPSQQQTPEIGAGFVHHSREKRLQGARAPSRAESADEYSVAPKAREAAHP